MAARLGLGGLGQASCWPSTYCPVHMDLSIVMPAFNEEATIVEAVRSALEAKLPVGEWEVVVVENGSSDRTRELLRAERWPPNFRIVELDVNRGKGGALRVGAAAAKGTFMAVLDADLEYDPNDFAKMLPAMLDGDMDAVLGTRLFQSHSAYSFIATGTSEAIASSTPRPASSTTSGCPTAWSG